MKLIISIQENCDDMDKQLFDFLTDLKKHNNREWFTEHKCEFETAKSHANHFFDELYTELSQYDDFQPLKIYRIYRDVRFSKDKSPYKLHFSALYSRKQPQNRGSFYVHLQPGESFVGGGFWGPEKEDLLRIRKAIEFDDEFLNILNDKDLKSNFGELTGEQLKLIPKGFDKAHPRAELLKFKQFLLTKSYPDQVVFEADFLQRIVNDYQHLQPFFRYMTEVLTTNENGESLFEL